MDNIQYFKNFTNLGNDEDSRGDFMTSDQAALKEVQAVAEEICLKYEVVIVGM